MLEQLETFLEHPTQAAYFEVRDAVLREDDFQWASLIPDRLSQLADRAQFDELLRTMDQLPHAWALCPRIHYLAAIAAEAMGDDDESEIRHLAFLACVKGLLASGSGTEQDPYWPTYLTDELDVLTALRQTKTSQELVRLAGRYYDVVTTASGRLVWFDVTDPMWISQNARERRSSMSVTARNEKAPMNEAEKARRQVSVVTTVPIR